jgi:hypothetical protein
MTITEIDLSASAETPVALTIVARNKVKKVKLMTKPVTMPIGFLLPSATDPERITGKIGKIQGDRIVTTPAKKAKTVRSSIF